MNNIKSKFKRYFLLLLHLPKAVFLFVKYYIKSNVKNRGKCNVFIDTDGLDSGRRMAQIVLQLKMCGFNTGIKISFHNFFRYQMWIGEYTQVCFLEAKMVLKINSKCLFIVCSKNNCSKTKSIVVDDDISKFKDHIDENFFFPILFHPFRMKKQLQYQNESTIPCQERNIGVLFVGNNSTTYSIYADSIQSEYHMYTRNQLIEHIKSTFPAKIVSPSTMEEWDGILQSGTYLADKIVILDKIRIEGDSYWELLQKSKFHLWTVGVMQPYCHNQIESMSCGCIPILQNYAFYPDLINGNNCYKYNNFDELDAILEKVLQQHIDAENMSSLILENYKKHFSKNAFYRTFHSFINDEFKRTATYYICPKIVRD